jgi:hypothetical protein
MPTVSDDKESKTRTRLAIGIVGLSVIGIIAISCVVVLSAASDERDTTSQLVYTSVLPLLGTWVGTVMAFYFARENLKAATDSTLALAGRGDTETPVTQVMIDTSTWTAYDLGPNDKPEDLALADLHTRMSGIVPPARRLPIRNAAGAVLYVVHDSTLVAFTEFVGQTRANLDKTLGDLLANAEFKELIAAIGFVAGDATVADARRVMASIKHCNDVFVTETGKRDERAIGWLTNTLLAGVQ